MKKCDRQIFQFGKLFWFALFLAAGIYIGGFNARQTLGLFLISMAFSIGSLKYNSIEFED